MEKPNRPDSTPASGDLIGAAAAEFEAAIAEISVDPRDIPRGAVSRIRATPSWPTLDRERQAATLVRSFLESITELIRNDDRPALRRLTADMEERCRRLAIPERNPTFAEEIERVGGILRAKSWAPEEVHGLERFWRDGDRFTEIQISSIKFGDRMVSRREVRAMLHGRRPNGHSIGPCTADQVAEFEAREEAALRLEKQNQERRALGQEPTHREW